MTGVSVTLAGDVRLAPAWWSRLVARTVRCPGTREPARAIEWLLDFGRRSPGDVLYPTSDEFGRLDVRTLFIGPGSPWEDGYSESFNGKLRDELLDREIFYTLREPQVLIECSSGS